MPGLLHGVRPLCAGPLCQKFWKIGGVIFLQVSAASTNSEKKRRNPGSTPVPGDLHVLIGMYRCLSPVARAVTIRAWDPSPSHMRQLDFACDLLIYWLWNEVAHVRVCLSCVSARVAKWHVRPGNIEYTTTSKGDGEALAPTGQFLLILCNIRLGPWASNLLLATGKCCLQIQWG